MTSDITIETFIDAIPYSNGRSTYELRGPLGLVFDYFRDTEDPSHLIGDLNLQYAASRTDHLEISEKEFEFFCYSFGIVSDRFAKKHEVWAIMTHCERNIHQRHDMLLEQFINSVARLALFLYPRLPRQFRTQMLAKEGRMMQYDYTKKQRTVAHSKVTDLQKWRAFIHYFHLHSVDAVKQRLKIARKLIFQNRGILNIPKELMGRKTDLFRMGMHAQIGLKCGRTTNWNVLPHDPLSTSLMIEVRKLVNAQPKRDWRRFNESYINFGRIIIDDDHQRIFAAKIKVTDTDTKYNGIRLAADVDSIAPECAFIPRRFRKSKRTLSFGTSFQSVLLIDTSMIEGGMRMGEWMFYVNIYGQKELYLSKHQRRILQLTPKKIVGGGRMEILCQIPVYVDFVRKTEEQCFQRLPELATVKSVKYVKLRETMKDIMEQGSMQNVLESQRPKTAFN